jgi:DNA-binding CsgD family transcriptional regulator/tetratricopeptide (TPR) repeat protein
VSGSEVTRLDTEWPLTGRDNELRLIATALDDIGGIVLDGGAGIGKTRLARAALASHPADQVRWVIATYSARRIPLGAFGPLLGELPDGAASALACAHAALGSSRTLLAVDDAHLLDDASATLLHQLAIDRATRMVVTVRAGEPAPDAVTALWKDDLVTRLEVSALSQQDTTTLLELVLGGALETTTATRLFTATAGNILWLRHLLDGERASKRLVCSAGIWHWVGKPRLGPALTALIEARIGQLSEGMRGVLELLALGEPLEIDLLRTLTSMAAIEDAADRDLVTADRAGGRWEARLAHPLYGDAVRARMNPLRARRLRGQLVGALTGAGGTHDVLRHAVLAVDSDLPPDPDLFLAGATRAALLTDIVLFERLIRAACECGGGFEAQLTLGFCLCWQHRGEEAEQELAAAARLADTDRRRLRVAITRAVNLFFLMGRLRDAHTVLGEAESCCEAEVELLGIRALFAGTAGQLEVAGATARRALDTAGLSTQAETAAAWALAIVEGLSGRGKLVSALVARAIAAARRAPETAPLSLNIAWWEVFGLGLAGWPALVNKAMDRTVTTLSATGKTMFQTFFEGWHALLTGQAGTAAKLLRGLRPYTPGHGSGWTVIVEVILAHASAITGDAASAREALERADVFRHPGLTFIEPQFALAKAWLTAAEGSTTTAVRQARHAAMLAAQSGQFAIEVLARHSAVSFGDRAQAFRLAELAHQVDGPRAPAAAAHAAALAKQDPVALLAASAQLAAAELILPAAEAAAQAAMLHRQQGDRPAAVAAASRAAELAMGCDGARTPALVAAAQPLPISDRQREIAVMAAHLSNREIAERLGISVRTVEGHIYQACMRLDLPDRAALSALFSRRANRRP